MEQRGLHHSKFPMFGVIEEINVAREEFQNFTTESNGMKNTRIKTIPLLVVFITILTVYFF